MKRMLSMCLSLLIHHCKAVFLFEPNHAARSIPIYSNIAAINDVVEHWHVVIAWEDGMDSPITGVLPHIKQLVGIEQIKDHGMKLPAEITQIIMSELRGYLENK
eukprot:3250389-Ditylum_brightwellii.AAC.1